MEKDTVEVLVVQQGDAVCGSHGYMLKKAKNIAAFYLDGWGKTSRVYPSSSCRSSTIGGIVYDYPNLWIEDGQEESTFTEICFPEYEGWRVHCVSVGKIMAICLVKD